MERDEVLPEDSTIVAESGTRSALSEATPPGDSSTPATDLEINTSVLTVKRKVHDPPPVGWIGKNWWGKGKSKSEKSLAPSLYDSNSEEAKDFKDAGNSHNSSAFDKASRKPGRSVFETLGFSILNPTASTNIVRQRRTHSVANISSFSSNVPSDSIRTSSGPPSPALSTIPLPPHLTTTLQRSRTNSITSFSNHRNEYPQGSSLTAIVHATRVMTSDPGSILTDQGMETAQLIAELAMKLVQNARQERVELRDRPKEKKDKVDNHDSHDSGGPKVALTSSDGIDATQALTQTLSTHADLSVRSRADNQKSHKAASLFSQPFTSPLFGSFITQHQKKISSVVDAVHKSSGLGSGVQESFSSTQGGPGTSSGASKPGSVPLESIVPFSSMPPTQYLSKTYTPITARDFRPPIPLSNAATRFSVYYDDRNQEPLTDRYGFMYDVSQYDLMLLLRAKECENTAPACLTGLKIADRREDNSWPEEGEADHDSGGSVEIVKRACDCEEDDDLAASLMTDDPGPILVGSPTGESSSSVSNSHRSRGTSPSSRARKQTSVTVSSAFIRSWCSILSIDSDVPRHVCPNTIRRLLARLTEIHDEGQASRRKEWDLFVRQRGKVKAVKPNQTNSGNIASPLIPSASPAFLGLRTADEEEELLHTEGLIGFAQLGLSSSRDERREFDRLVRSGIPLVYRAKVWLECSGGLEMKEPGLFHDLLAQVDSGDSMVKEIEKDVGRTMPLNIFYGGDGPGVQKLRRVLNAYSRYVLIYHLRSLEFLTTAFNKPQSCCGILPRHESRDVDASVGLR
jgi:small G protein signaling modulator 3